jgi:hypothetical protein
LNTPRKTRIEWAYTPEDFLESPLTIQTPDGSVTFDRGRAVAELVKAAEPVPDEVCERLRHCVTDTLRGRQLLNHAKFDLKPGHRTVQEGDHRTSTTLHPVAVDAVFMAERADVQMFGTDGTVIVDTKAERIVMETAFVDRVQAAALRSPLVRQLLESYSRAVDDPKDEFIHLYEVRDAIDKHYGGARKAQAALGLTKARWRILGGLANAEPVEQGRHRGLYKARRRATAAELDQAREAARAMIEAVVGHV